mmetsp:Transcript_9932/g.12509  ORF Transcript_9932/g.12509 Transcript_9932/m.12509 type:complete len:229 (+) Transcript_9932:183-869(+)
MFRRKNKSFQPSRNKLDVAISAILEQAINIDSEKAPEHLRLVLLKENPDWKLPERRVARYLKRHLKARESPKAEEIDADLDEQTVYTTISTTTTSKDSVTVPSVAKNDSIPENSPEENPVEETDNSNDGDTEGTEENTDEDPDNKADNFEPVDTKEKEGKDENDEIEEVPASSDDLVDSEVKVDVDAVVAAQDETTVEARDVTEAYVDDNDGAQGQDIECFGLACVIS